MEIAILLTSLLLGLFFIVSMYFHFKDLNRRANIASSKESLSENEIEALAEKILNQMMQKNISLSNKYDNLNDDITDEDIGKDNVIYFKPKIKGIKNVR